MRGVSCRVTQLAGDYLSKLLDQCTAAEAATVVNWVDVGKSGSKAAAKWGPSLSTGVLALISSGALPSGAALSLFLPALASRPRPRLK